MRCYLLFQFFLLPLFSEFFYFQNPITYAGMTIECTRGCGSGEDPDLQKIEHVFASTVGLVFKNCAILDESLDETCINPWGEGDLYETEYSVWDWRASNGLWPSVNTMGELVKDCPVKHFSIVTYPKFLEVACALREDVYFYYHLAPRLALKTYKSLLTRLQAIDLSEYESVDIYEGGKFKLYDYGSSTTTSMEIKELVRDTKSRIKSLEKEFPYWEDKYHEKTDVIEKTIDQIDSIFRSIFLYCLEHHQPEGIAFNGALESFIAGDADTGLDRIRFLIDYAEKYRWNNDLISKLYLLQGQVQSEYCLYAEAIVGLTKAIQKNPSLKEAYFERAAAYLELGNFDKAIEDFLASDFKDSEYKIEWRNIAQISAGIATGVSESAVREVVEFVPETLNLLNGIGNGIWAFSSDPVGASKRFVNAVIHCVEYLRSYSAVLIVQNMIPELKELIQNYDQLIDYEKGKQIGLLIGKYGTDVLLCKYSMATLKAYRELKQANQFMILEAAASSKLSRKVLEERWVLQETILKESNLIDAWHKGTFENSTESLLYHLKKHGRGRSAIQYTEDGMTFFETYKKLGTTTVLRDGSQGIKIQLKVIREDGCFQKVGGYWSADGKLVTFWD